MKKKNKTPHACHVNLFLTNFTSHFQYLEPQSAEKVTSIFEHGQNQESLHCLTKCFDCLKSHSKSPKIEKVSLNCFDVGEAENIVNRSV